MTSRQGRRLRRVTPTINRVAEERPPVPEITCPHCGGAFPAVFESVLDAALICPHCKSHVTEADYAKAAVPPRARRLACGRRIQMLNRPAQAIRSFAENHKETLCGPARKAAEAAGRLLERLVAAPVNWTQRQANEASARLASLARDGYYASVWHCRTRIPLHDSGKTSLEAKYSTSNRLLLTTKTDSLDYFGTIGEFSVFSALQEQTKIVDSPLYGCILVPNLYIPIPENQRRDGMSYWRQIDLVILAPECACVVEVKHWATNVFVDFKTGDIFATRAAKSGTGKRKPIEKDGKRYFFRGTLDQNSTHAEAFDAVCPDYPFDRIFEATVFSGCHKFKSSFKGFDDNVYAGAFDAERRGLIEAFGSVRKNLDPRLSQDRLAELAESLLERFGDLNQKRGPIHMAILDRRSKSRTPSIA